MDEKFEQFLDYLEQEQDSILKALAEDFHAGNVGDVGEWSLDYINYYRTQFMSEVFNLSRQDPTAAAAALVKLKMDSIASTCLATELLRIVSDLHLDYNEFPVEDET